MSETAHKIFSEIIESQKKKEEVHDIWENSIFRDLVKLKSNNAGNAGEIFLDKICKENGIEADCDGTKTKKIGGGIGDGFINKRSVEIKTAHQGCKNFNFQHELGESPWKADYLIFLDISPEIMYLTIFKNFSEKIFKSMQKLDVIPQKRITWRKRSGSFKLDTSIKINDFLVKKNFTMKIYRDTLPREISNFILKKIY